MKIERVKIYTIALVVAVALFLESYIPYYIAGHNNPPMASFLGQVEYTADQNMYFSFIRQAFEGNYVFTNRLTAMPNDPTFFNIEFLMVGQIMRLFDLSENGVYQIWRFLGAFALVFGFAFLLSVILSGYVKKVCALFVFAFSGGGFGIFLFMLGKKFPSYNYKDLYKMDVSAGTNFPFEQAITNPHFSLPHGLMLIGLAAFILAERRPYSPRLYIASGMIFFVDGLIRPYDLISLSVLIPVFIVIEARRHFDLRKSLLRTIPLVILLPALAYSIWLFKIDPAFKYWSEQGHNSGFLPPPYVHIFSYGIIGILATIRIAQYRTNPISPSERFLCVWFAVVFCLSHIGRVIPALGFSPQMSTTLFAPLVLLAFSLRLRFRQEYRTVFISIVAALIIVGNLGILAYHSQKFIQKYREKNGGFYAAEEFYANDDEISAYNWINTNANKKVILASPLVSGRICKYTDALTVIGHYAVTPLYDFKAARVREVLSAPQLAQNELHILHELGTEFLFIGPEEEHMISFDPNATTGLTKVFAKGSVAIYRVEQLLE